MQKLNLGDLVGKPYGTHQHFSVSLIDFIESCDVCAFIINLLSCHEFLHDKVNVFVERLCIYVLFLSFIYLSTQKRFVCRSMVLLVCWPVSCDSFSTMHATDVIFMAKSAHFNWLSLFASLPLSPLCFDVTVFNNFSYMSLRARLQFMVLISEYHVLPWYPYPWIRWFRRLTS